MAFSKGWLVGWFGIILVGGMLLPPAWSAEKAAIRPNFVFIFADDLGYGDLACYGHPYVKTPNLDRLASQGTRFTQAYVTGMTCCPSRTGLMTGKYPATYAKYMSDFGFGNRTTVTELLHQHGYSTGHCGKWHIGPNETPGTYGIDEIAAKPNQPSNSKDQSRDSSLFQAAIEFLEANADKPFYLNVWGHISHFPVSGAEDFLPLYEDLELNESECPPGLQLKFEQCRSLQGEAEASFKNYLSEVTALDAEVGRLLKKLDELGLSENTIVVFSSDHGPAPVVLGVKKDSKKDNRRPERITFARNMLGSPGPFRGGKHTFLEGGVRVPFIIRWPDHIPANVVNENSVISFIDWLPSICQLAGISSLPDDLDQDGEDISDIWLGADRSRTLPLFWRTNANNASSVVRFGNWKYFASNRRRGTVELYDLLADPREENNLAEVETRIVELLQAMVEKWEATLPKDYVKGKSRED
ncbi:Cerebroside-sulfatase [Planctomycetales bacterium 10988]|nr:Cerebroside-sulfatase [Planctomycetales bacterium 10988]